MVPGLATALAAVVAGIHTTITNGVGAPRMPFWTAPRGDEAKCPGLAGFDKINADFNAPVFLGTVETGLCE